jgi:hypothetical protein
LFAPRVREINKSHDTPLTVGWRTLLFRLP